MFEGECCRGSGKEPVDRVGEGGVAGRHDGCEMLGAGVGRVQEVIDVAGENLREWLRELCDLFGGEQLRWVGFR